MGLRINDSTRNMAQAQPHLQHDNNGQIWMILRERPRSKKIAAKYCAIGKDAGQLYIYDKVINKHPNFRNVVQFEGWVCRYIAEHDFNSL